MEKQLTELRQAIAEDFANWRSRNSEDRQADYDRMFNSTFIEEGRKYIKVIRDTGNQQMVWGFVVKGDNDKKFRQGDILKAASWAAPARNAARGNILDGDYDINWTGPLYL